MSLSKVPMMPQRGPDSARADLSLTDIRISFPHDDRPLCADAQLSFLALVDTRRLPLRLGCSSIVSVDSASPATATRFDALLCPNGSTFTGHVGILASVTQTESLPPKGPSVTEVLFFATSAKVPQSPPTPPRSSSDQHVPLQPGQDKLVVKALLLSTDLFLAAPCSGLTPPPSPGRDESPLKGVFVERTPASSSVPIDNEAKRKRLSDTFDEASKKRQRTKRNLGESVALAAPRLAHPVTAVAAPLARQTPSLPATTTSKPIQDEHTALPKPQDTTLEARNKSLITRLLLAGLRLHGLSQPKAPSRPSTSTSDPSAPPSTSATDADSEFKYTYHHALRFITYAFRAHMSTLDLAQHTAALRDAVDRALETLCSDPLLPLMAAGHADADADALTPGGRTPFRTPRAQVGGGGGGFPFPRSTPVRAGDGDATPRMTTAGGSGVAVLAGNGAGRAGEEAADVVWPTERARGKMPVQGRQKTKSGREPGF